MSEREHALQIFERELIGEIRTPCKLAIDLVDALSRAGLTITPQAGEADTITAAMSEAGDAVIVRWMNKNKDGKCFCPTAAEVYRAMRAAAPPRPVGPIPMILFCPSCGLKHIDAPQPEKGWTNPPHRSHECQGCGLIWRPADIETTGVYNIQTRGKNDSAIMPTPSPVTPVWQPISTAPRDGTHILVYPALLDVPAVASWQRGRGWLGIWRMPMTEQATPYQPTHWQPLPSPPDSPGHTEGS